MFSLLPLTFRGLSCGAFFLLLASALRGFPRYLFLAFPVGRFPGQLFTLQAFGLQRGRLGAHALHGRGRGHHRGVRGRGRLQRG